MPRDKVNKYALRNKHYIESLTVFQHKPRFGCFSYTPYSIGENTYTKNLKRKRMPESGKPVFKPRQCLAGGNRRGKHMDECYFTKQGFHSIGDKYLTATERKHMLKKKSGVKIKKAKHESNFKPARNTNRRIKSAYIHMQDTTHKKLKKNVVEGTNKVIMKEKANFYTNPAKKGHFTITPGIHFNKQEWQKDDYNRKRNKRVKTAQICRSKRLPSDSGPYRSMHYGMKPLNSSKKVIGETKGNPSTLTDKQLKEIKLNHKDGMWNDQQKEWLQKTYKRKKGTKPCRQDGPWKPNNPMLKGKQGSFKAHRPGNLDYFPPYMENPVKELTRNKAREDANREKIPYIPPFRGTLKKPTPSISTQRVNLLKNKNISKMLKSNRV